MTFVGLPMVSDDDVLETCAGQQLFHAVQSRFDAQRRERLVIKQRCVLCEMCAEEALDDGVLNALFTAEMHETMGVHRVARL